MVPPESINYSPESSAPLYPFTRQGRLKEVRSWLEIKPTTKLSKCVETPKQILTI